MANPFTLDRPAAAGSGGDGPMQPGDIRVIHAKDKSGNITKTFTLQRTTRPYAYDLADAYNAERSEAMIRNGGEWYVTQSGELRLGDSSSWTERRTRELERTAEDDRNRWKAAQERADDR